MWIYVQVTDRMLKNAKHMYPYNTPNTKEAYFYRMEFEKHFPQVSHLHTLIHPGLSIV
jgi:asparagine synthase (glutamine-hydrolysing)